MYITVTSIPFGSERDNAKCCAYYGRSSSGFVNETLLPRSGNVQVLSIFIFLRETSQQHKGRLLADVTFCLFFRRVSFLAETSLGMITNNIEQHIWRNQVRLPVEVNNNRNMPWTEVTRNTLLLAPHSSVFSHLRPETWWNKSCLEPSQRHNRSMGITST